MSPRAFLFPGQGSQKVGMGRDLLEGSELGKDLYQRGNNAMGMDIASLSFHGPEEELRQTRYTQPSVFIVSVVLARLLMEKGLKPSYGAGHSLGEYSALTAAGVFSFVDAIKLVKIRGESMQDSGTRNPGTMAAIIGLGSEQVKVLCEDCSHLGVVTAANFNSQSQVVISGNKKAVREAVKKAREMGANRAQELNVSGAFHSSLMSPAKQAVGEALEEVEIKEANFPVIMNVSAMPTTDPEEIKRNLVDQIDHPVRWLESVAMLRELGVTDLVEVGPGTVLRGLARRIDRSFSVSGVETLEHLRGITGA